MGVKVFAELPPPTLAQLRILEQEPLVSVDALKEEVGAYMAELERKAPTHDFLDLGLARDLANALSGLLVRVGDEPPALHHQIVQLAVRYFVLEEDVEDDTTSLLGFDDDVAVVNAVARHLGADDLVIQLPD